MPERKLKRGEHRNPHPWDVPRTMGKGSKVRAFKIPKRPGSKRG